MTPSFRGCWLLFWQLIKLLWDDVGSIRLGPMIFCGRFFFLLVLNLEMWSFIIDVIISLKYRKCRHYEVSSIDSSSYPARPPLWLGWNSSAFQNCRTSNNQLTSFNSQSFSRQSLARPYKNFPACVQLNPWLLIYEELPHRCLSPPSLCSATSPLVCCPTNFKYLRQHGILLCFLNPEIQPPLLFGIHLPALQ